MSSQAEQLAARDQAVEFRAWLQHALQGAQVTVDPRYGTFDPSTLLDHAAGGCEHHGPVDRLGTPVTGSDVPPTPGP